MTTKEFQLNVEAGKNLMAWCASAGLTRLDLDDYAAAVMQLAGGLPLATVQARLRRWNAATPAGPGSVCPSLGTGALLGDSPNAEPGADVGDGQ